MRASADKPSIMNNRMKAGALSAVLFILISLGASAEEPWSADAKRADAYYRAGDYNAAWLFYERALERSCSDGIHLFQAAESFRLQELIEDTEFSSALYAVAHHFLTVQYPQSSYIQASREYFPSETVVNRRFLRQTFGRVGGEAPRLKRPVADELGAARDFLTHRFMELRNLFTLAHTEGIRSTLAWARPRVGSLLFSWLLFGALTGIVLPVVMAAAVSLEGRKSYVTAYAFLLHWGFLGIHRFYLGRWTGGVIWLLTGGLLGIGVFFDLFLTGAYVRFWNEDHRSERPVFSSRPRERAPRKRSTRNAEPKARPARKPKLPGESKPAPAEDEFSFDEAAFEAPPGAPGVMADTTRAGSLDRPPAADHFGDLPDLDFDGFTETDRETPEDEAKTTPPDISGS